MSGEVHLWLARAEALAPHEERLCSTLSATERLRIGGYARAADRARRAAARGALRVLLARHVRESADDVVVLQRCPICRGPHGPLLVPGLFVSMAYAPAVTAFALACAPVGVDLEPVPPRVRWRRAVATMPEDRRRAIGCLPEPEQPMAFVVAWTLREAVGKALGCGLTVPDAELAQRSAGVGWTTRTLGSVPGHIVAVAVATEGATVRVRELTGEVLL